MTVLQRHERRLGRAHHHNGERHRHHRPKDGVQPERRGKAKLHPEGQPDHDGAEQEDHTDCGSVAGIMGAQVETADIARVAHFQQVAEQPPFPTARAAAGQRHIQDRSGGLCQRSLRQRVATTELAPHQ